MGLLALLVAAMLSVMIGCFLPSIPGTQKNALNGFVGFSEVGWSNSVRYTASPGTNGNKAMLKSE